MSARFRVIHLRHCIVVFVSLTLVLAVAIISLANTRQNQRPLLGWLIAVDAGHGGEDKGAWFPNAGLIEKDINLDVAQLLGENLARQGAAVILLRTDDTLVQLGERAQVANAANARIYISLHVNRYPQDTSCCGAQAFYQSGSEEGEVLAKKIQALIALDDPTNHRQALPADYKVLRESKMPAVLVEIGFATNPRDRQLILDPAYRQKMAILITQAVLEYATLRSRP